MTRIEVEWHDSGMHIDHGWAPLSEYIKDAGIERMSVTTVGILAHETDDLLFVALSYDPSHDTYYGMQAISKTNIVRREERK